MNTSKEITEDKLLLLMEFAEIIKSTKSVADEKTGQQIWTIWQKVTGRTDRFRACGACLVPKVLMLKKLCTKNGIKYV